MTTVTVGTNDTADNTGDLIVSFVDASPPGVTTDGMRTALPGAPWGSYLVATSVSPQAGCVVTLTPTSAVWESCSLIWQPPPHAAILWTSGGVLSGSGGATANPKFPSQSFSGAGTTGARAGIQGSISVQQAASGGSPPPAPAAAVGYNTRTFGPAVQPLGTNLRGFTFFGNVPPSTTQNVDGSITIAAGSNSYGGDLCTAGFRNGSSSWSVFDGVAFGGGCYAEAVMSGVSPASLGITFWLNDIESMNGGSAGDLTGRQWPGQVTGYGNWIEVDIAEADASGDSYGLGDHNWYGGPPPAFADANTGSYPGWVSPVTPGVGIDWSQPHRFGWLWVPASGSASSTNILPNSTETGVVVGTPGAVPTGWDFTTYTDGLSTQVVSTGTVGGVPYFDFRLFGFTSGSSDVNLFFCPISPTTSVSGFPAPSSTQFTLSVGLAVVAGTQPASMFLDSDNRDASGNYISSSGFSSITLTSTLATYQIGVASSSSSSRQTPQFGFFRPAAGTAVDVTFRVSNPQFLQIGTSTVQGYQKFYFDGVQVGTTLFWNQWSPSETPPPQQGTTAYNVLDTRHVAFIFGIGSSPFPATVYSLNVWQKDTSKNIGGSSLVANPAAAAGAGVRLQTRAVAGAIAQGAGGISADFSILHQSANQWFVSGSVTAAAAVQGRIAPRSALIGRIDAAASVAGNAVRASGTPTLWQASGDIDGAAGISSNPWIGHQYFVAGRPAASASMTFSPATPLRVTNWVQNPRPDGAVIGTVNPTTGAPATNWFVWQDTSDLTASVVQVGTESGIPFIDLLFSNPSSVGGTINIQTDDFLFSPQGLNWSYSQFTRLSTGSLTNVTSITLCILSGNSSTGALLNTYTGPALTVTNAGLSTQWSSYSTLINDAGMDVISPGMFINHGAGAVNLTVRIGGAKAEKSPTATGSQYLVVPAPGLAAPAGGSTSFVY